MKKLLPLLLLGGCVSHWPAGSYNGLLQDADSEILAATISECVASLVPNHAAVRLDASGKDTLSVLMPEALSRQGLIPSDTGLPVTYVAATTGTSSIARDSEGAFVRVRTPQGICSQYFYRDAKGILTSGGPVMIVTQ